MRDLRGFYATLHREREKLCLAGRVAEAALSRGDQSAAAEADAIEAEIRRVDAALDQLEAEHHAHPTQA
ncbi:MAG: hypothetical protein ACTHOJ_07875 [Sphingomonas oligoaromativorans]